MASLSSPPGHPVIAQANILVAIAAGAPLAQSVDAGLAEPVLTTASGVKIAGGGAIVRHLARWAAAAGSPPASALLPAEPLAQAHVDQWLDHVRCIERASAPWLPPTCDAPGCDDYQRAAARAFLERGLAALDAHVADGGKAHLVGGRLTVADVAAAGALAPLFGGVLSAAARAPLAALAAYLARLLAHPAFAGALGAKLSLCAAAEGWHCAAAGGAPAAAAGGKKKKGGGAPAAAAGAPAADGAAADGAAAGGDEEKDPEKVAKKVRPLGPAGRSAAAGGAWGGRRTLA